MKDTGYYRVLKGHKSFKPPVTIVFLHGTSLSHQCWLRTATELSTQYGVDALLLDFFFHGASPPPPHDSFRPEDLVQQLRAILVELGWEKRRITIAGLSLGGAVAQLYHIEYPNVVERLVLAGSGGLKEEGIAITRPIRHLLKPARKLLRKVPSSVKGKGSFLDRARCFAELAKTVPDYGVPQDTPR